VALVDHRRGLHGRDLLDRHRLSPLSLLSPRQQFRHAGPPQTESGPSNSPRAMRTCRSCGSPERAQLSSPSSPHPLPVLQPGDGFAGRSEWRQSFVGSPANSGGVPWLCGPALRRGCLSREGLLLYLQAHSGPRGFTLNTGPATRRSLKLPPYHQSSHAQKAPRRGVRAGCQLPEDQIGYPCPF
jgi:hypothetical protein